MAALLLNVITLSANSMEQFSFTQPIRVCTPFVRVEVLCFSADVEVIP